MLKFTLNNNYNDLQFWYLLIKIPAIQDQKIQLTLLLFIMQELALLINEILLINPQLVY